MMLRLPCGLAKSRVMSRSCVSWISMVAKVVGRVRGGGLQDADYGLLGLFGCHCVSIWDAIEKNQTGLMEQCCDI